MAMRGDASSPSSPAERDEEYPARRTGDGPSPNTAAERLDRSDPSDLVGTSTRFGLRQEFDIENEGGAWIKHADGRRNRRNGGRDHGRLVLIFHRTDIGFVRALAGRKANRKKDCKKSKQSFHQKGSSFEQRWEIEKSAGSVATPKREPTSIDLGDPSGGGRCAVTSAEGSQRDIRIGGADPDRNPRTGLRAGVVTVSQHFPVPRPKAASERVHQLRIDGPALNSYVEDTLHTHITFLSFSSLVLVHRDDGR